MSKNSLLLDADVIIYFYKMSCWNSIISHYKIYISSIVIDEVKYFKNERNVKIPIKLKQYQNTAKISELSASPEKISNLLKELKKPKLDGLHDGELESIAIMRESVDTDLSFCVKDRLAILAMAYLGLENMISIEEALTGCGVWRKGNNIKSEFSKKRLHQIITEGKFKVIETENN